MHSLSVYVSMYVYIDMCGTHLGDLDGDLLLLHVLREGLPRGAQPLAPHAPRRVLIVGRGGWWVSWVSMAKWESEKAIDA